MSDAETKPRRPETLADVRAGDEVMIDSSSHGLCRWYRVAEVTPHYVIIGLARFCRADGRQIRGNPLFPCRLAFGERAIALDLERRRAEARDTLASRWPLTQAGVTEARAACAAAEAVLRECGEWCDAD